MVAPDVSPSASLRARRPRVREGQRTRIATAIIEAITHDARGGLTVTSLAKAIGVSRKTFYAYFGSLDEAMAHAMVIALRHLMLTDEADAAPDGLSRLMCLFGHIGDVALSEPGLMRFIGWFDNAFREDALRVEAVEREYRAVTASIAAIYEQTFRDGQADGSIRSDLDARFETWTMGNAVLGLAERLVGLPWEGPVDASASFAHELTIWRAFLEERRR